MLKSIRRAPVEASKPPFETIKFMITVEFGCVCQEVVLTFQRLFGSFVKTWVASEKIGRAHV